MALVTHEKRIERGEDDNGRVTWVGVQWEEGEN